MEPHFFISNDVTLKRVRLEGAYNVRDIGGYVTADGRVVRPNMLFRSDSLHALTAADQEKLQSLGIRTIIDLRHPKEIKNYPNLFAQAPGIRYLNLPFYHGWRSLFPDGLRPNGLAHLYTTVLDNCQETIAPVMTAVTTPQNYPLLIHCQVGKDRTGMVVALLLSLLKVPEETIVADYALSHGYLQPVLEKYRQIARANRYNMDEFEQILLSPPQEMARTLHHLRQCYGSPEKYIVQLGLKPARLHRLRRFLTLT